MPGHAGSPYWAAVDFDSEEEQQESPNHRVYLDPWDNEAYGIIQDTDASLGENFNSFAGEPVSASFYYVPTKNYDSEEEAPAPPPPRRNVTPPEQIPSEYAGYGRKMSRVIPEMIYNERPMRNSHIKENDSKHLSDRYPLTGDCETGRDRRRSMYIEEPVYAHHPMIYEPLYGHVLPPPPGYLPPPPRSRISLPHHPEYMMANLGYGKHRRHSRLTDAYEHFANERLSPEYEDWARPFPKTAPDNFHLSRYGHLQIDYSCSWNSLDRLIRNQ